MDGIYDLGGMSGFGTVKVERDEPVFHERWESRAYAVNMLALQVLKAYNIHEYRHSVERMTPSHYLAASYYERWFTGVATLFVEKGIVTHEELTARAGGPFPLAQPPAGAQRNDTSPREHARFAAGDVVVVRDTHPRNHVRAPRFVRGRRGVVLHVAPPTVFPGLAGHGLPAHRERTYHVEFQSQELWTDAAGSGESVIVDLFESYLEVAS